MIKSDKRDVEMLTFVQANGPSRFSEIWTHLNSKELGYAKTKSLAHKLATLCKHQRLQKKSQKGHSVYSLVSDLEFEFAIAGEVFLDGLMLTELGVVFPSLEEQREILHYFDKDVQLNKEDSSETRLIKLMVTRYGFYLLAALVKSFDYWILKTNAKQSNLRTIWLNHALDLSRLQKLFLKTCEDLFLDSLTDDTKIKINIQFLKKRIKQLKKSLKRLYPKSYEMIDIFEHSPQEDLSAKHLRNDRGYLELLNKQQFAIKD